MTKHVLVVGGTRGIGSVFVNLVAAEGHVVSVVARREPPASNATPPNTRYWQADITDRPGLRVELDRIVETNGAIHNLVFFQRYRGERDADDDGWAGEIETSLTATRNVIESLSHRFDPSPDYRDERSIVLVSSANARWINPELPSGYHVAKAGIVQIARYYAVALGPKGVRVNVVSPGTVVKDESLAVPPERAALLRSYRRAIPLGRIGTAQEVARVVSFLCGSQSSFITGQEFVVDGGASLRWQESLAHELLKSGDTQSSTES